MTGSDPRKRALYRYLAAAARTGDENAIAQLAKLSAPSLLAHAARLLRSREMAEDAVQAAWIEIIRGLPRLVDDTAFLPWAMRIVSRRVAAIIRDRQKQRKLASEWSVEVGLAGSAQAPSDPDAVSVRAMIDQLDPAHRAVLALFYLEEMSVAEVALSLDIPTGTVKSRLMHARQKLRNSLEGDLNDQD
ncbi:RNA polymerase sigma factor [Peteryoungia desertarenae]|uniref:RNA polymerase sigma factor n=1 Tax=Peteryoungia desertarenae TaxID=1813451 RepID=A0ABX6QLK9_9HYPH|nr:RNA polymerase sigma factor [Peteryoungia desertarenae]QLF69488.1 RNA polymerase sigma factor [Peteryoungia desertarenae]